MGSKEMLKELQKDFRNLAKLLESFAKPKYGSAEFLDQIRAALDKLPDGAVIAQAVDELRDKTEQFERRERRARIETFGTVEAEFIGSLRSAGVPLREVGGGWRINSVMVELKGEVSKAQLSYNRKPITRWSAVGGPEDLHLLIEKGEVALEKAAIPDAILADVFWSAFEECKRRRALASNVIAQRVPALDFYRYVRLELARRELEQGKPDGKLRMAELPEWAFLYNVDRFRGKTADIPLEKRLGFEAGSQKEQSRGMGIVINGLDPSQDYKVVCHVIPSPPAAK